MTRRIRPGPARRLVAALAGAVAMAVVSAGMAVDVSAEPLPIFDAHVHYSHDAVDLVPPEEAVAILRKAGLRKALISSSDDRGTQLLHAAAPDLVVPSLRPYRRRGETGSWVHDPTIIDYVEGRLANHRYRAIGEFHVYGDDVGTPVVQRMIELAKQHGLLLHAHSDAEAIDQIFRSDPDAFVLWAHSGFDRPEEVADLLRVHPNLWADLAFRTDQSRDGRVSEEWQAVFEEFPDRFMVGSDTFTPERWYYVEGHAEFSRQWLSSLPEALAERIGYRNAEQMLERVEAAGPR